MLLAALLASAAALPGIEPQSPSDLQAILALSIDPGFDDQWNHTNPDHGLHLSSIGEVVRGQAFQVCVFMTGHAAGPNGRVDSTYDIEITRPDGTTYLQKHEVELRRGEKIGAGSVLRANTLLGLAFSPTDPLGRYTVRIEVHDRIGGRSAQTKEPLTLTANPEPRPFKDRESLHAWELSYYRVPTPLRLLDALGDAGALGLGGSTAADHELRRFLCVLLDDNTFLVPLLLERFPKLDHAGRLAALSLLAGSGLDAQPFLSAAAEEERRQYEPLHAQQRPDPLHGPIRDAVQVDELWGLFFASGRYAPIERLARALTLDEELDGGPKQAGTQALEEAVRASLRRNLRLPRVRPYCEWMLANGRVGEDDTAELTKLLEE